MGMGATGVGVGFELAVEGVGFDAAAVRIADFRLNRCVSDPEIVVQGLVEHAQDACLVGNGKVVGQHNMAREEVHSVAHRPDVQIVDVDYRRNRAHSGDEGVDIQIFWRPLKKDIGGLADNRPGGVQDEQRDKDGHHRVGRSKVGKVNQNARYNNTQRRESVASHVDVGGADVQAVLALAVQPVRNDRVHDDRDGRHLDHRKPVYRPWMHEDVDRAGQDRKCNDDKGRGVREGRQDGDPMIAERFAVCCRPPRHPYGVGGEAKRKSVARIVSGVGKQGKRMGSQAEEGFEHYEQKRNRKRNPEQAAASGPMRMTCHSRIIPVAARLALCFAGDVSRRARNWCNFTCCKVS